VNKYVKVGLGIIGTIFLGAIGSGLWELFLSGFIRWLGSSIIGLAASVSQVYLDSLHKDIWRGAEISILKEIYIIVFVIYLVVPIITVISVNKLKARKSSESKERTKNSPNIYLLSVVLTAVLFSLMLKVWKTEYAINISSAMRANIDILSPAIDSGERLNLLAMLSNIKDQHSAITLQAELIKIAEEKQVKIHNMDVM
jgi:heme/copper-type cytochrome/quinol oxidase subunit 2